MEDSHSEPRGNRRVITQTELSEGTRDSTFWKRVWERERDELLLEGREFWSSFPNQESEEEGAARTAERNASFITDVIAISRSNGNNPNKTSRKRERPNWSSPLPERVDASHSDDDDDDDEIQVLSSTTINPNVDYPHKRPDCGVYTFERTAVAARDDSTEHANHRFCPKCFCVVCDAPVDDCPNWNDHCHIVTRPVDALATHNHDDDDEILLESPTTTARNVHVQQLLQELLQGCEHSNHDEMESRSLSISQHEDCVNGHSLIQELMGLSLPDSMRVPSRPRRTTSQQAVSSRVVSHSRPTSLVLTPTLRLDKVVEYVAPYSLRKILKEHLKESDHITTGNGEEQCSTSPIDNLCSICNSSFVQYHASETSNRDDGIRGPELPSQQYSSSTTTTKKPRIVQIPCGHKFHRGCILASIMGKVSDPHLHLLCPNCHEPICEPKGKSPSGSLTIQRDLGFYCPGYTSDDGSKGVFRLDYHIPRACQLPYHHDPGAIQSGVRKTCYLPITDATSQLVKRLSWAFSHGMTFSVQYTNDVPNCTMAARKPITDAVVCWSRRITGNEKGMELMHKTRVNDFDATSDPAHFEECHKLLDAWRIPP